jgi:hypothetical protein
MRRARQRAGRGFGGGGGEETMGSPVAHYLQISPSLPLAAVIGSPPTPAATALLLALDFFLRVLF